MAQQSTKMGEVLQKNEEAIFSEWIAAQVALDAGNQRIKTGELKSQCREFLELLQHAFQGEVLADMSGSKWEAVRDQLAAIAKARAEQGFSASETASFIFSLKQSLFPRLLTEFSSNTEALKSEIWTATRVLDQLGLFTTEVFQKAREAVISRQQQELLELSTPVVKLWDGILAVPLIGTLDSARTQVVMESLLQEIVDTESEIAIIDITGVPTVDTLVAQHLLKTIAATRLMGAECIISGIRPSIAQTIVHLGVELGDVTTKATLADAFLLALDRLKLQVVDR